MADRMVVTGALTGTGAALDVTKVGFKPRIVKVYNAGNSPGKLEWNHEMAEGGGLKALAGGAGPLSAVQATVATATIGALVVDKPCKLTNFRTSVGTTGTAGSTTVQVHKNGVSQGELTTANTEADGTKKSLDLDVDCVAGDLIEFVVSAAPTAGAALAASAAFESASLLSANGITPLANGFTLGADGDVNVSGDQLFYEAWD